MMSVTTMPKTERAPLSSSLNRQPVSTKTQPPTTMSREERTRWIWRHADSVCFDVDSTVCEDEAIDELAKYLGCGEEVAQFTRKAMNGCGNMTFRDALTARLANYLGCGEEVAQFTRKAMNGCGNMTFRDALTARLAIMKPTREQFETYARTHEPKLTVGIKELIKELKRRGIAVYLVSGGFRRIIMPVARLLGIPREHVFANELLFDDDGTFAGFDLSELTSDSGTPDVGKPAVCQLLKQRYHHKYMVMVGDGSTDMEASPPADAFVGFGGNQVRENVRREASWFVYGCDELIQELSASEP
uniref:Phosphoserine phosphatase n=1 Tax=Plectus sambesii TaxID=2011161 RepID=A0A914WGV9_9BILA